MGCGGVDITGSGGCSPKTRYAKTMTTAATIKGVRDVVENFRQGAELEDGICPGFSERPWGMKALRRTWHQPTSGTKAQLFSMP
jgi:hypothetical protein